MAIETCTVIVVGYHGERWLGECLSSLARGTWRGVRLVLVDNGGNGAVEELPLSEFDSVVVKTPRAMGFAEANNRGLVAGGLETEAVCFLNQDTVSEPGWLNACLDCLGSCPEMGAVSPLLRTFDGSRWDEGFWACARRSEEFERDAARGEFRAFYDVPEVSAAAMVVRTGALRKAGPFDPVFGSYYEDYDLCRRIREAGYRVGICGGGTVRHFGGSCTRTPEQERKRMRQIVRNRAIHQIRGAGRSRVWAVAREFLRVFPWNVARGLARTASSQPVGVQVGAHVDLVRLWPRLVSQRRDREEWERYLEEIEWSRAGVVEEATVSGGGR